MLRRLFGGDGTKRVQYTIDEAMAQKFEELGVPLDKNTYNNALSLMEWYIHEEMKGNRIVSVDPESGDQRELFLGMSETIRQKRNRVAAQYNLKSTQ